MSPTLNTLEQLSSSSLRWGMLDTYGSGYQLFRASTSMEYQNMEKSMEKVLQGNYAFISWKTYFRNLIARDYTERNGETQVHIAREDFFPGGFGWAFPKGSPYRTKFDQLFQRLIESGLIDKWMSDLIQLSASKKRDRTGSENGTQSDRNGPQAFTIYHLQGVFFITVGGFGLAAVTFLIETTICKFNNN
ncbi:glutamate receptor 3-like [Penaeus indicus]|uniref:glutamate receptor 3-like n=1 Tax=Penaeus indicus TaxID=29960 RepID=UPI00300D91E1